MRSPVEEEVTIGSIECPFCGVEVEVDGMVLLEALWLHEYECGGIVRADELAAR
jgi:hypothetical protein